MCYFGRSRKGLRTEKGPTEFANLAPLVFCKAASIYEGMMVLLDPNTRARTLQFAAAEMPPEGREQVPGGNNMGLRVSFDPACPNPPIHFGHRTTSHQCFFQKGICQFLFVCAFATCRHYLRSSVGFREQSFACWRPTRGGCWIVLLTGRTRCCYFARAHRALSQSVEHG